MGNAEIVVAFFKIRQIWHHLKYTSLMGIKLDSFSSAITNNDLSI